ncbi:hypothetical protein V6N13_023524 [Hibiscus sabdariffa]|uniref:Probable purine permease n=1 Tax=Hibiscus sabdariffa TaxID=183260 RepID=A0ABR2PM15_9ROSI
MDLDSPSDFLKFNVDGACSHEGNGTFCEFALSLPCQVRCSQNWCKALAPSLLMVDGLFDISEEFKMYMRILWPRPKLVKVEIFAAVVSGYVFDLLLIHWRCRRLLILTAKIVSLEQLFSSLNMGEMEPLPLSTTVPETEEPASKEQTMVSTNPLTVSKSRNYKRWLRIGLFTFFVLAGQSIATLLGRLYFEKGGKSQWLATLTQLAGFPLLILYYCLSSLKNSTATSTTTSPPPSALALATVYVSLGLLVATYCFLFSIGLRYLPVSTYSLISTSQLAFNAFFSFFLNSQKFTPSIVNSLILLTISSVLLVSHEDSSSPKSGSRGKYAIGFICTILASAANGLDLALAQLCFRKVIKNNSFSAVMSFVIFQSLIAASAMMVGLFVSGEWKGLKGEMEGYELGKLSYIMVLVWICILWQGFSIGTTALLFEVSSLFANSVSVVALPIIPILAVIFFGDKMDVIKVVAMFLALWGFISYAYQHYLDDQESKSEHTNINVNNEA